MSDQLAIVGQRSSEGIGKSLAEMKKLKIGEKSNKGIEYPF